MLCVSFALIRCRFPRSKQGMSDDTQTDSQVQDSQCPNCGSSRSNRFCSVCGQNDRDYSQSLLSVISVAFRETFEMDSRVARTLGDITIHPGRPSAEFAKDRRARYVTPFRLYLFSSLLYFFILSLIPDGFREGRTPRDPPENIQFEIYEDRPSQNDLSTDIERFTSLLSPSRQVMVREMLARESPLGTRLVEGLAQVLDENTTSEDWLVSVAGALIEMADSPQHAVDEMADNLPLAMFALLPWFAVLLAVFYIRKHMRFVYHLVFAMHAHSFAFILFSIAMLIGGAVSLLPIERETTLSVISSIQNLVLLGFIVHLWISFKTFYEQSILATTLKIFGIVFFYSWMLVPALLFVFAFTIFQFM